MIEGIEGPSAPWLALKLAQALYDREPAALAPAECQRLAAAVRRQAEIERRILATPEAAAVALPPQAVEAALAEIQGRYRSDAEFAAALRRAGLEASELRAALAWDLRVTAVLEQIGQRAAPVTDDEIEAFYRAHPERSIQPERRTLRHLLITINDDLPDNRAPVVWHRISAIRTRVLREPARFAEEALAHSECPTALQGGLIGILARGRLYPELDAVAFALAEGELSEPIASPLGLHLVRCERIYPAHPLPLHQVRERIRTHLQTQRQAATQRRWIAGLLRCG